MPFLAPIFTAISAFAATSAFAAFAVKIGTSLLLSAVSQALIKKPEIRTKPRLVSVREPISPRQIVYGQTRKGGVMVYVNTRDFFRKKDQILDLVLVMSASQVKSIGAIYLDGNLAFDAAGVPQGKYVAQGSVQKQLGSELSSPLTVLQGFTPSKWTPQHLLRGCAAIYITLNYNQDVYPQGIPNITADMEGKNDILDPRAGVRGYTTNAALCVADYMSLVSYGIGAAIGAEDGINTASLIAAANVCDETVAKVGGGTEKRYAIDGVLDLSGTPQGNIEAMLTAMAGTCGWQAGQWNIYAGAYRTPVLSLTANDVVEGGLSLETRISRAENFNAVRGVFISPDNDWQPDDFPAYESAVYLAEDNNERTYRDISLPYTISASMAQRLAKIELERNRRQFTLQFSGKLGAWQATVGDTVQFSYARFGFTAKPFDVTNVTVDLQAAGDGMTITPQLVLRETSSLVYDWTSSEAKIYAAAPRTTLPSAFDISPPGTPSASEYLYQTRSGDGVKAAVLLTWPESTSAFVERYQVDSRLVGGEWVTRGRTDGLMFEILDIAPGNWEFRVKALSVLGVSSTWEKTSLEVVGLGAAPAAMTGVTIQSAGGLAVLKWTQHPDVDVRIGGFIVVRHSASTTPAWNNSVSMDRLPGATAIAVVPLKPGAYVLRAEDSSGNLGPEFIISTAGAVALNFTGVSTLTEDATFTGTKTNCFVTGGTLQMSSSSQIDSWASVNAILNIDNEGGIVPAATYDFATGINAAAVTRMRLRSVIELSILNITDQMDTRTGTVDQWLSIDGPQGDEVDCYVEVRTTQTDPAGSPVWSGWGRADSTEVSAWGVQARAQMLAFDPSFNVSISKLRLIAEKVV